MEITTSIFRRSARTKTQVASDGSEKTVKVKGGWVYRIRYTDTNGKARVQERSYRTQTEAKDAMNAAVALLKQTDGNSRSGERMTFNDLADICEIEIYHPARYEEDSGKKRSGVKSVKPVLSAIKHLRSFFGNQRITSIKPQSLINYRERRKTSALDSDGNPVVVKIATINKELAALRRMLQHAVDQEWIAHNPFKKATKVINVGLEQRRRRVLLPDEEIRLLAACTGRRVTTYIRKRHGKKEEVKMEFDLDHVHLRAAILLGLDCGLRRNEITSLEWNDVHFGEGYITIRDVTAKDEETRYVPLTARLEAELNGLREISPKVKIFPMNDWKASFTTVRDVARIEGLWFRDLRRTFSHRLSHVMPLETVAQVMGHASVETTHTHYQGREAAPALAVKAFLDQQYEIVSDQVN